MQSWEERVKSSKWERACESSSSWSRLQAQLVSPPGSALQSCLVMQGGDSLSCFASSSLLGSVSQQHQREGARQVVVRSLGFPCPSASRQSPLLILAETELFLSSSLFHFIRLHRPRLTAPCPATPASLSSVPTSEGRVSALATLPSSWLPTQNPYNLTPQGSGCSLQSLPSNALGIALHALQWPH